MGPDAADRFVAVDDELVHHDAHRVLQLVDPAQGRHVAVGDASVEQERGRLERGGVGRDRTEHPLTVRERARHLAVQRQRAEARLGDEQREGERRPDAIGREVEVGPAMVIAVDRVRRLDRALPPERVDQRALAEDELATSRRAVRASDVCIG